MTPRAWGWLLLLAACLFVGRYAWLATTEMESKGPAESGGLMSLTAPDQPPPPDLDRGRTVRLVSGGEALLLQRTATSARLWSADRGEWIWFTDDLDRHIVRTPGTPAKGGP